MTTLVLINTSAWLGLTAQFGPQIIMNARRALEASNAIQNDSSVEETVQALRSDSFDLGGCRGNTFFSRTQVESPPSAKGQHST